MYEHCRGALVLVLALTASPVWGSTTGEHERLAYHHVRPGTVDCCMDAVIDRFADTISPIRWMPFIGTRGWATYHCSTGTWTVNETQLRATLDGVRDDVAAAGYLMLDWEAYSDHPNPSSCLNAHPDCEGDDCPGAMCPCDRCPCDADTSPIQDVQDRIARMKEAADIVAAWLDEQFEPGHGVRFGYYRIPDHKHPAQQTGNAYVEVLENTNTIFITLHSYTLTEPCFKGACTTCGTCQVCDSDDCAWRRYQCRVACHAPAHDIVTYFFGAAESGGCECVESSCTPDCSNDCCYSVGQMLERIERIDEYFPGSALVVRGRTPENAPGALATARNRLFELQDTCPWDCEAVADRDVGIDDFLQLLSQWIMMGPSCDFNGDGVGIDDFFDLMANWGPCP